MYQILYRIRHVYACEMLRCIVHYSPIEELVPKDLLYKCSVTVVCVYAAD